MLWKYLESGCLGLLLPTMRAGLKFSLLLPWCPRACALQLFRLSPNTEATCKPLRTPILVVFLRVRLKGKEYFLETKRGKVGSGFSVLKDLMTVWLAPMQSPLFLSWHFNVKSRLESCTRKLVRSDRTEPQA